ncbi:MAG: LPS export ABC transporter permease LptF [Desulfobacterales bacterium]|nr:LPS export ABC transporter permease LptF [Desulfobacterales bacterium]MBF0396683.1 LPS export ABC transporter permease LptF [Desulfobacterales bacterium]
MKIITRYIFKEMLPPFFINIIFFTFIFLMVQLLEITNMVVNYQMSIIVVGLMLVYSMPYFLVFVIPMSVMMSVLLTFLRLSSDNEIVALKSCGFSNYTFLRPAFLFAFIGWAITSLMIIYGMPNGEMAFKGLISKIAQSSLHIGLKERTFNDSFKGVTIYVSKINPKDKSLQDIFIEDQRTENMISTVIAPKGVILKDINQNIFHLRLHDGTINQVSLERKTTNAIHFDVYDVKLDLEKAISGVKTDTKSEKEMLLSELKDTLKSKTRDRKYYAAAIEFHKKFSIPFSCIVLGFLAVPLGLHAKSSRPSLGLGLGLIFFLLYYLLLSAGRVFAEKGTFPPEVGMWSPNILMALIGIYLFYRRL